jgi:O-antigen chain-terminating methyltransferase
MQQKRLITLFLEEARRRLPEPFNQEQLQAFLKEDEHALDAFYVAFEDQFRGSQEDIRNRLKVYLPLIEEAKVGTPESAILDVGCGRGEWLELLRESGYTAKGLDINRVMLEQCRTKGLEVIESDVIAYLQSLPDASLGAVTGFHIIEHLPFEVLIKLVDETMRVLYSGGLAIFESPNPENIIVGACNFYSDPTHRNPLFPPTVKFLFAQRGFSDVQLLRLSEHRLEDPLQLVEADNAIAPKLNPLIEIAKCNFYASPDFAVIAKKY